MSDSDRFDELAKALASGASRQQALKAFAASLVGAAFGLRGSTAQAEPACREAGHPCEGNQECCPGLVCVEAAGPGSAKRCQPAPTTTTTTTAAPTTTTTTTAAPTTTTTTTPAPHPECTGATCESFIECSST